MEKVFIIELIFNKFLLSISSDREYTRYNSNYVSKILSLIRDKIQVSILFETGSYSRKTWIKDFSDFDYFIVLNYDNYTDNSFDILNNLENLIKNEENEVKIRCPSVKVSYYTHISESVEITPSFFCGKINGYKTYLIPDCNNKWHKSSPESHAVYLDEVDAKLQYRVKPLIKLLKAWKYYNNIAIKSLYIELVAVTYARARKFITYENDIINILKYLTTTSLRTISDPVGITDSISPYMSFEEKDIIMVKIEKTLDYAKKAKQASRSGKMNEALELWDLFFQGNLIQ